MAARYHIYSTLTADQNYTVWTAPSFGNVPHPEHQILIKGGANVADKFQRTVRGMETEVSEEDFEILKQNEVFQRHVDNGFITYRKEKVDPEVAVATGMQLRDDSAPKVPEDFLPQKGPSPMDGNKKPSLLERLQGA